MEFSGKQVIEASQEKVWAYLYDVNKVAECAPGFQSLEVLGEEHWKAIIAVGVGPVKAKFTLDVTREMQEPEVMIVKGRGKAPGSAVELSGNMKLSAIDNARTQMDWSANVVVSGTIASVGARLMSGTAEKLTDNFLPACKQSWEPLKKISLQESMMGQSALERWQELLAARAQQMDAAYARLGRTSADFWERRAQGFHSSTKATVSNDPLFLKLRALMNEQTDVLDVGAGTGRFTLALAPFVRHVMAVEPNAAMLQYLQQDATEQGLTNITSIPTTWEAAPVDMQADIVVCSHVLYPIWDITAFLEKLRLATRNCAFIYMWAVHFDALTAHLWQHFHGDERHLSPSYIHAVDVMYELGMYADVEIVELSSIRRYPSLDIAVNEIGEQLILPDDERTRSKLRALLEVSLVQQESFWLLTDRPMLCAIIKLAH